MARQSNTLASSFAALAGLYHLREYPIMAGNAAPTRIATPDGEAVISTPAEHTAYDEWSYTPARRAGDYVYVSGVVVARH